MREEQLNLFDQMGAELAPGDYVRSTGKQLTFREIERMVGRLIVLDVSTASQRVLQVVRVVTIGRNYEGRKRLIYDSGRGERHYGYIDKIYITRKVNPVSLFEI